MAAVSLTRGAIPALSENNYDGMKPVLQVMEVKPVTAASPPAEMFRMLLSDGVYLQQAMLTRQMNAIVKSGELRKGSIVQLHLFTVNVIQGRRIIIIFHLEVLVSESPVDGAPQNYYPVSTTSQGRAPVSAQSPGMDQSAVAARNPQPYAGTHSTGTVLGQYIVGEASLNPKTDTISNNPSYGGSYMRNMNNVNSLPPIAEQSAAVSLTSRAIAALSENHYYGMKLVLQVTEVKLVTTASSLSERFWILLSDGVHHQQALLATQMNHIKSGELRKGSIIQLHEFITRVIKGRRIIIIIHLEVLVSENPDIGTPQEYNSVSATSQCRAPVPAQSPCRDDLLSDLVDGVMALKF